jgi:pilus assembly protein CpaE
MPAFIVSDSESTSAKVREVLLFAGQDCPTSHIFSLDQAPFRLAKEQPDLVVVAMPSDPERGLTVLGIVRDITEGRVLAVGPTSDSKLVIRALRGGADDYVDATDLEAELEAALARLAAGSSEQQKESGRLVVFLAPNGGCGASTLCVNVAATLAKEHKSVGLFDLKLETGDLAALLDVQPAFTLADLCQNISRLDRVMFERSLVKHPCGIHLLAPPRLYSDVEHVTSDGLRQALSLGRGIFPYVVVDLDHHFRGDQNQILRQADTVVLVFQLNFVSLRNTRRALEHLERLDIPRDRVQLVVNRYGQPKEVPATKAEEALGMKIAHYIPEDARTVNRANNNGVPVVLEAPSARVSKCVRQLALSVSGTAGAGKAAKNAIPMAIGTNGHKVP